jgi:hypothetical protein
MRRILSHYARANATRKTYMGGTEASAGADLAGLEKFQSRAVA